VSLYRGLKYRPRLAHGHRRWSLTARVFEHLQASTKGKLYELVEPTALTMRASKAATSANGALPQRPVRLSQEALIPLIDVKPALPVIGLSTL
jgi:hypothetical protein